MLPVVVHYEPLCNDALPYAVLQMHKGGYVPTHFQIKAVQLPQP